MKKTIFVAAIATMLCAGAPLPTSAHSGIGEQLVKTSGSTAVYVIKNNERYVFPNLKTYQSWYGNDFSAVTTISNEALTATPLKGNVTHKPGALIKIQTDPTVYEVLTDAGDLAALQTEQAAIEKFGADWATKVSDVPDVFFLNYSVPNSTDTPAEPDDSTPPPSQPDTTTLDQTPAAPSQESSNLLRLTTNQTSNDNADIAWSGSNYGIAFAENNDIYFIYINAAGSVGPKTKISLADTQSQRPKIIWEDNYFVVVWTGSDENQQTGVYFAKLNTGGQILIGPKKILTTDADSTVDIAGDDGKYAIAWDKETSTGQKGIFFSRLDDVGMLIKDTVQVTAADAPTSTNPVVGWDTTNFGVFWQQQGDIYYSRFDINATRITDNTQITNTAALTTAPNIVWDGTAYALVFLDGDTYWFNRVYVNGSKTLTDSVVLSTAQQTGTGASIAFLDNFYYVAAEYKIPTAKKDDSTEVYLLKVAENGNTENITRLTYDPWPSTNPAITGDADENVGLVWTDGRASCENCSVTDPKRQEIYFLKQKKQ